jgi:uncharacterized protein (DUF1697 family)
VVILKRLPARPTTLIALLRAINLGARNRVPMSELRALFADLGYERVKTHLQSGNVVFDAQATPASVAEKLERELAAAFGFDVPVMIRTADEMAAVVADNPFATVADDGSRLFINFLSRPVRAAQLEGIDAVEHAPNRFALGPRAQELYVWCPNGLQNTKLGNAFWERRLGVAATARNWNTASKLVELAAAERG